MSDDRQTPPCLATLVPPEPRHRVPRYFANNKLTLRGVNTAVLLLRWPAAALFVIGLVVTGLNLHNLKGSEASIGGFLGVALIATSLELFVAISFSWLSMHHAGHPRR